MRKEVIGNAMLYCADCRDVLPMLEAVDAVVTDPPYFLPAVHYNTRREFPRSLTDLGILEHYFASLFGEMVSCMRSNGVAYVFCDGQSYPAFYATAYRHFRKLRPLIWDKITSFNGYTWRHQHEIIMFLELSDAASIATGDGDIIRCGVVKIDDRDHPAEKPPKLIELLIRKSVNEGGLVCDPFMGSGATAVACHCSGRRFVGVEREPAYFDIACRRIEQAQRQRDLFVDVAPATDYQDQRFSDLFAEPSE